MAWVSRETRKKLEEAYRALRYAMRRAKREPPMGRFVPEAEKRVKRMKKELLDESRRDGE